MAEAGIAGKRGTAATTEPDGAARRRLPLRGIRVVDFTWVMAGPLLTSMLADLGAEVIKVETRTRLDGSRLGRPIIGDQIAAGDRGEWPELQPLFHAINRNKRGITVNLKHPEATDLIRRLVAVSDVVTDNFNAGVMQRLGLDYPALRTINPSVVAFSMSGAGQQGPLRNMLSYANIVVGLGGIGALVGYQGDQPLGVMRPFYGDTNASLHGVVAVLGALYRRRLTAKGEFIDLSQWESAICGLERPLLEYEVSGAVSQPSGNHHPWMAPHGNYRCEGTDNWIAISCARDAEWQSLCHVLGLHEAAEDPRFGEALDRLAARDELDALIGGATGTWDKVELARALQGAGVAAAPVMNIKDQQESEHFRARGVHIEAQHPRVGYEMIQALPWRTARSGRGTFRQPAPILGQDNVDVLGSLLGLSQEAIADLEQSGVLE